MYSVCSLRAGHVQCVLSVWGLDMYSVCCLSGGWTCTVCAV